MPNSLTEWVQANCPAQSLRHKLIEIAGTAEQRGEDFHMLLGTAATRSGRAFLIHRFAGEYFMFPLSDRQAVALDAVGPVMRFFPDGVRAPRDEPRACRLSNVEFVQDDSVDLTGPIKGSCICRFEGSQRPDACLQLEMELCLADKPNTFRVACFYCYPAFSSEGMGQFEFAPRKMEQFARGQFVGAFLTVCTAPDPPRGIEARPISNAAGVLVTTG